MRVHMPIFREHAYEYSENYAQATSRRLYVRFVPSAREQKWARLGFQFWPH